MLDLDALSREEQELLLALLEEHQRREARRLFHRMYPAETNLELLDNKGRPLFYARDLYPKHMEFFAAGARYRERCAMCANRVGKTFGMGGYETSCHLTGLYPDWWPGRRFDRPRTREGGGLLRPLAVFPRGGC